MSDDNAAAIAVSTQATESPPARLWFSAGEWARLGGLYGFIAFLKQPIY